MLRIILRARGSLTLLPCLCLLAGCEFHDFDHSERFQSDFHYSYDLSPGGRLEVENFNGPVEISSWDQNKCEITGTKFASSESLRDRIKIETNHTTNLVEVRTIRPSGDYSGGNMGARYVIHVPRRVELDRITSSNGSIHVENIEGAASLKTSNGAIKADTVKGAVNAHTSNGSVTVANVTGAMSLRTSNSPIRAEDVSAAIEASTSNGGITVHFSDKPAESSSPLKFETNNGPVNLTLATAPKSDIRVQTSNGGITLRMPAGTSARVRAETTHGRIQSDFPQSNEQDERGHRNREFLEQTLGGGGPLIDLHTSNGGIRLLKM